jgi:hypothetical protein
MTFVEPFSLEKYNFYKEITNENQYYNVIQRNHYLDHGCICNTCCYKRRKIVSSIKNGEKVDDIKIIHEEAVQEKKNIKMQRIKVTYNKILDNLKKISKTQNRSKIHNTFEMNIK